MAAAVVKGDPCLDIEVFDRLVDAVKAAYYDARFEGVVWVTFRFEGGDYTTLTLTQPFESSNYNFVVLMDEDRRPLLVFDLNSARWSDVVGALLSLSGAREREVTQVEVEVGERW